MGVITSILLILALVTIIVLAVLLVISLYLGARAVQLYNMPGSFECHWLADNTQKWHTGVAQYNVDGLTWYRLVALSNLPELRWSRSSIIFDPKSVQVDEHDSSKIILNFKYRDFVFILNMSVKDYEGFISWLEAGLPTTEIIY